MTLQKTHQLTYSEAEPFFASIDWEPLKQFLVVQYGIKSELDIKLKEDAPDWTSSRNQKRCVVALYDEYRDYFYYLHVFSDRIYVATMITGQSQYFVNAESNAFFLVTCDNVLVEGMDNIPKFKPSNHSKCRNYAAMASG